MTQEQKELLLKDLCARLPYNVKVAIEYSKGKYTHIYNLRKIDNDATSELRQQVIIWNYGFYNSVISYPLIDCRPYLRPMSSMTKEEKEELVDFGLAYWDNGKHTDEDGNTIIYGGKEIQLLPDIETYDWLNAHHFDYRGLIEQGLAIEVTKENNPYKN